MNSVRHGRPLVQQRGLHRTALHERVPCASRLHASRLDAGCHLSANRQRAIRLCAMRLPANRRGLTLLEIILALAIFFGSLAALAQLSWNGSRAAVQARLKTQAIIRCEAKLAEILAGAQRLQSSSRVPFPDNAAWTWSLSITETNYPDLLQLDVTVSHSGNARLANTEFTLRRWMRDPALFQDAALKKKQSQTSTKK